jgi:hypothetical protein
MPKQKEGEGRKRELDKVELELHRNKTSRLAMLYTRDFRSFVHDNFGCHVKSTSKGVERGMEIACLQQTLLLDDPRFLKKI